MTRKIVIKRLSASDLTFFEYHYRHTSGTKQKALNFDRVAFIDKLYPALPEAVGDGPVKVSLSLRGPGKGGVQNIQRKILKQDKNWRLNGELVYDPPELAGLYSPLQKGDYAIIEFVGGVVPDSLTIQLVAQAVPEDAKVFAAIGAKYGAQFSARMGMIVPDVDELMAVLESLELDGSHPISDLIETDYLEDAALGGAIGLEALARRPAGREVTKAQFQKSQEEADRIGRLGEELVNWFLEQQKANGQIEDFEWTSKMKPFGPFDFRILAEGVTVRKIDVKSTVGKASNPIHVSMPELREIAENDVPYDIYRMYNVKVGSGRLLIGADIREFGKTIYASLSALPAGVVPDSFSIETNPLKLDGYTEIIVPNEEEESA